jgi:hypothetical protein
MRWTYALTNPLKIDSGVQRLHGFLLVTYRFSMTLMMSHVSSMGFVAVVDGFCIMTVHDCVAARCSVAGICHASAHSSIDREFGSSACTGNTL